MTADGNYRPLGFQPPRMPGLPSVERGPELDSFFAGAVLSTVGSDGLRRDESGRCGATS